jgi:hypothetical protein
MTRAKHTSRARRVFTSCVARPRASRGRVLGSLPNAMFAAKVMPSQSDRSSHSSDDAYSTANAQSQHVAATRSKRLRTRHHRLRRFFKAHAHRYIAACALSLPAWSALAQSDEGVPRVLLDTALAAQNITLLQIVDNGIVYVEQTGLVRSTPFTDIAALYDPNTSFVPAPWIELTDGQRFTGSPALAAESTDDIFWTNPVFGTMRLSLDHVRLVVLDPDVDFQQTLASTDDQVVLRNGDVLSGFIEDLGDTVGIDTGSGVVRIGIDRLAAAHFANDPTDRNGIFLWLADGTVAQVGSLRTNNTLVEVTRSPAQQDTEANEYAEEHAFPLSALIALIPRSSVFHPLASMQLTQHTTSPQRRWTPPPNISPARGQTLDAADIALPGPMRLQWALPKGSHLLAFDALLPQRSRVWGDCEILVHAIVDGRQVPIAQTHLSGDHPSASVIAVFPADSTAVAITLDAGRYGPAQDDAVLRNAFVLIESP